MNDLIRLDSNATAEDVRISVREVTIMLEASTSIYNLMFIDDLGEIDENSSDDEINFYYINENYHNVLALVQLFIDDVRYLNEHPNVPNVVFEVKMNHIETTIMRISNLHLQIESFRI